ncbi:uncharacterized protein LOC130672627 isoform X2 [Microplitis mediator]|uniref:uncharacterized protein LOC130672627 isoform X2 n=1 Tax=Microplitis mediator TaxID=375433 RepID=UPI0025558150|nr:uncharacterized protein LOC130672627 isoform X2 [Microplitis mediator]
MTTTTKHLGQVDTDGRFNYRCLQNSTIVSYDASEFEEVSFGVWRSYPKCSKFIGANEKAQWEINFDECAAPGTRQIDIILESYRPGDMDSLVYSLSVDCDIQGR